MAKPQYAPVEKGRMVYHLASGERAVVIGYEFSDGSGMLQLSHGLGRRVVAYPFEVGLVLDDDKPSGKPLVSLGDSLGG